MGDTCSIGGRRKRVTAMALVLAGMATAGVLARGRRVLFGTPRVVEGRAGVRADDGVQLRTESLGPEEAPVTVVFAHGFASDAREFRYQCRVLGRRARVVLFDQRGHGRSGWGSYRSATMERLGRDLGEVVAQQAGGGPILLVGHSMGGMAVMSLAGQCPGLFEHRVVGVGLLSTAAGQLTRTEMPDRLARAAVRTGSARVAAWSLWFLAPVIDWVAPFRRPWGRRWLVKKLFGDGRPSPAVLSAVQDTWVHTRQSVVSAFYPAMVSYNRTDSLAVLRRIPVLVLTGDHDQVIPWRRGEHLAEAIGHNARLVVVPGAGHMVTLTHPEAVNAALTELLDQVEPRTGQGFAGDAGTSS